MKHASPSTCRPQTQKLVKGCFLNMSNSNSKIIAFNRHDSRLTSISALESGRSSKDPATAIKSQRVFEHPSDKLLNKTNNTSEEHLINLKNIPSQKFLLGQNSSNNLKDTYSPYNYEPQLKNCAYSQKSLTSHRYHPSIESSASKEMY